MMLGGDELCMTQEGNNNAYCQDNPITWLDWTLNDREREFLEFTRHLIGMRNAHAALRPLRYVESEIPVPHEPGVVNWRDADGSELMPGTWGRQQPRVLMLTIEPSPDLPRDQRETLLLLFNASEDDVPFRIPNLGEQPRTEWQVVLDTSRGDGLSDAMLTSEEHKTVPQCSLLVATAQ
jgi:glycogen operon protein